jgi:hypothetical protein
MGKRWTRGWLLSAIVALAAAGCSMGGGGSSGTAVVMSGVMLKGSVILNGVHFAIPSGTSIMVDGSPGSDADLNDGMVVTLKGIDHGNGSGTLEKLETKDELTGQVQAVDATAGTLAVLGQTIYVDDQTRYAHMTGLADLTTSDWVKVHGLRDSAGNIRATRIVKLNGAASASELKGVIAALTATTFQIESLVIDYSGAVVVPSGTALADGMRVEVRLSQASPAIASLVKVEDLADDPDLRPGHGMEVEIEGFVSGFTTTPGTFQVNGRDVETTSSTEFRHGSAADLANDVRVEVHGTQNGTTLVASEVQFEQVRIGVQGTVTAHTADTATVLGLVVNRTAGTEGTWPTSDGGHVRIRGYVSTTGSTLYADRIESTGSGDALKAPVQAEVGPPTYTMTLLGVTVDLSGAAVSGDEHAMTLDQFFAAVTPAAGNAGTPIQARGTFGAGTLTATEAELED